MKYLAFVSLMTLVGASPAVAQAAQFTLINGTGGALGELSIRRAGTQDWKALAGAPAAGAKAPISFKDPDCAFDIRASVGGSPVTWTGVNLCDVKSVTLNHDSDAGAWVDYDQ
jgi:hypothetical protein